MRSNCDNVAKIYRTIKEDRGEERHTGTHTKKIAMTFGTIFCSRILRAPSCLIMLQNLGLFLELDSATEQAECCQFSYVQFVCTYIRSLNTNRPITKGPD